MGPGEGKIFHSTLLRVGGARRQWDMSLTFDWGHIGQ